jgi:hypothetical protein
MALPRSVCAHLYFMCTKLTTFSRSKHVNISNVGDGTPQPFPEDRTFGETLPEPTASSRVTVSRDRSVCTDEQGRTPSNYRHVKTYVDFNQALDIDYTAHIHL